MNPSIKAVFEGYNVINQWFINYKPLIILEAITLAIIMNHASGS